MIIKNPSYNEHVVAYYAYMVRKHESEKSMELARSFLAMAWGERQA